MAASSEASGLRRQALENYFRALLEAFGPQGWWPAKTRLEVILGAILVQHTAWKNATLALKRLRSANLLRWVNLAACSQERLLELIRPAGFFTQKARTIRAFVEWLDREHGGSLDNLFRSPDEAIRAQLLSLPGIGPETADAILLYAGRKPFFVADAYTRRILARHELIPENSDYDSAQRFLHRTLRPDEKLFNEFHALLVETAKQFCLANRALCEPCPLRKFLPLSAGAIHESRLTVAMPSAAAGAEEAY